MIRLAMTCTLYRVQKHPFHGVHAAVKVKLTGIARVGAAAGLSLLGMLQPVVDLFRQVIGIVAAKRFRSDRAKYRVALRGELEITGTPAAGNGLQTCDGFNLDFRRVHIQVRQIDDSNQILTAVEAVNGRQNPRLAARRWSASCWGPFPAKIS